MLSRPPILFTSYHLILHANYCLVAQRSNISKKFFEMGAYQCSPLARSQNLKHVHSNFSNLISILFSVFFLKLMNEFHLGNLLLATANACVLP